MAFIDDVLIYPKVWEDHEKIPDGSFTNPERTLTFVKFNKCEFDGKK